MSSPLRISLLREFMRPPALREIGVALLLAFLVTAAVVPRFLASRERASVSRAMSQLHATAIAIEAYHADHAFYPSSGIASGDSRTYASQQIWMAPQETTISAGVPTIHSFAPSGSGAARLVTFRLGAGENDNGGVTLATLTTPIAYLPRFMEDPFMRTRGATFGYFAHGSNLGWILFSMGPDRDENATGGPGDISARVEEIYNINSEFPYMWTPGELLINATYDPTNGLMSNGDLVWMQGSVIRGNKNK